MDIFKLSPFVKNQFDQSPELKKLQTGYFNLEIDWQQFQQIQQHLDVFSLLRKYRQSRLALIAARDLENHEAVSHIDTLKQISQLAQLMIEFAYKTAVQEQEQRFGKVFNSKGEKQSLLIFGLGKLGGHELNYSSDVDLVFCYSGSGESNGKKSLDAASYFQRVGRRIIQILDSVTADGIVYRVDMRLRPFGSAAPLVCSVDNLLHYLESEGRDWERYAWLRASPVAGNLSLAKGTLKQIEPFIYRKYLDYNIFESLRQIKQQIARKQLDDLDNIKLGIGGIREIEFIVQTLQLTFAGRNKQLRSNDLWQQMHNLQTHGHLTVNNVRQLSTAWLFLRQLENLCQIIQDRDSHHLPKNLEPLAQCMRLNNSQELLSQLATHRNNVHSIFDKLFLSNHIEETNSQQYPKIQSIKDQVSKKNYPKQSKHKIYAAYDALIPYLETNIDNEALIKRYQQVITAISTRSSYLSMLIESPITLEKLVNQISYSAYFSNTIAKTPSLLETLFDSLNHDDFDIEKQWDLFTERHTAEDVEQYLEQLCQFKQSIQFKAITAYIDEINDAQTTSETLSELAEKLLSLVVIQAHKESQQNIQTNLKVDDLIIIAYGSLAMKNMHLDSDFDLVFILNQDIRDNNHKFIMRWIKRIIHLLSIQTYNGSLYQLDTQLRPNGNSGSAIVTQSSFENYQLKEAWIWEHAALIKSRAVYATDSQTQWFNTLRKQVLCQPRDPIIVDKELREMAEKLNQLGNKNHEQEFSILGEILKNAKKEPELIDNIAINPQVIKLKLDKSIE
jgi:glutamate-ammonia-ligase adenylyltransferase